MGPYAILVLILVVLITPVFWTLGFKLGTAFLVTIFLIAVSALIASSWTLMSRWIVGIN